MNTKEDTSARRRRQANQEFLRDFSYPGGLSRRFVRGLDPKENGVLYTGLATTGLIAQAITYPLYGIYRAAKAIF